MFRHAVELNWVCRVGNRGWCLLRSEPALSNTDYPRIDPGHQRKPGRGCSQGGPPSSRADQSGAARTDLTTRHWYCKDRKRRLSYERTSFTFLGYTFRARKAPTRDGRSMFAAFLPAMST